jgi:hypothetical protein
MSATGLRGQMSSRVAEAARRATPFNVRMGGPARPGKGAVAELPRRLGRAVMGAVAVAHGWWMMSLEALTDSEYEGLLPRDKPYVGLHTPDTDPVSARTGAARDGSTTPLE